MRSMNARPSGGAHRRQRLDVGAGAEQPGLAEAITSARTVARRDDRVPRARAARRPPPARSSSPAGCRATRSRPRRATRAGPGRPGPRRGAAPGRSPGRRARRAGPARPAAAASPAARSRRPTRAAARSRRSSITSSPAASARANGGGARPAPAASATSISRAPATPSSSTRQASTSALQREALDELGRVGSTSAPRRAGLAALVEAAAAGLGAELAAGDQLAQPVVDVEALAVGLVQVLGDRQRRCRGRSWSASANGPHRRDPGGGDRAVERRRPQSRAPPATRHSSPSADAEHAVDDEARARRRSGSPSCAARRRSSTARGERLARRSRAPSTTSTRRITDAGLKKCSPSTRSGRVVAAASSPIEQRRGVRGEDRVSGRRRRRARRTRPA